MSKKLKSEIKEYFKSIIERGEFEVDVTVANAEIMKIIDKHSDWIPVSERLPEPDTGVIAQWELINRRTNETEIYLNILRIEEDGGWSGSYGRPKGKVVAWQPLPEPYREG